MLENINELIDINLTLIYETNNKSIMRTSFKEINGKPLQNSIRFSEILDEKGLVNFELTQSFRCTLTEFGFEIAKNGGWLKFIAEQKEQNEQNEIKKTETELITFEKSKIDLELSKKMLEEYPYTKWFARIGFVIALILAVLEILQWNNK